MQLFNFSAISTCMSAFDWYYLDLRLCAYAIVRLQCVGCVLSLCDMCTIRIGQPRGPFKVNFNLRLFYKNWKACSSPWEKNSLPACNHWWDSPLQRYHFHGWSSEDKNCWYGQSPKISEVGSVTMDFWTISRIVDFLKNIFVPISWTFFVWDMAQV